MHAIHRRGAFEEKKNIVKPEHSCHSSLGAEILCQLKAIPGLSDAPCNMVWLHKLDFPDFSYNKVFRRYTFKGHCFKLKSHLNKGRELLS